MPILPFGEYRPDLSDYEADGQASLLSNVLPRSDGWGPFPSLSALTSALPAACRGAFYARKTDGSIAIFAGTSTRLYLLSNTDFTWTHVSKGSTDYSALSSTDQWQFAQFGNFVIAVQANTVPQSFDLTSSTNFADLGGSPPQSRYVAVVGRFLMLAGLLSNPYRVQWSGLNAITTWTSGTNQSDFQDFPDGGITRGVAGGEFGVIFQDAAIRRITYAPGSPTIFQIDRIADDRGLAAPYSLIRAGDRILFYAQQGFHQYTLAGGLVPIGKERVDRTFAATWDSAATQLFVGASDPGGSRVFWAYKSLTGSSGQFDKLLCFDYGLNRWSPITQSGEYVFSMARPGLTLENLDSISSSIDALTFSLDDVSTATNSVLSIADSSHRVALASGTPIEATLTSAEKGAAPRFLDINGFRPITDAGSCFGSILSRATLQGAASQSAENEMDEQGFIPALISARYCRGRIRIPAGTTWTFATGVEPDAAPGGMY